MADDADAGDGEPLAPDADETNEAPAVIMAKIQQRGKDVDALLKKQQVADALKTALADPPTNTRDENCKDANYTVVRKAIMSVKEVDPVLSQLSSKEADVLMKYLYKGLASGEKAVCDQCLRLHERLTERVGVGSIIRALGDSKHTV
eukprot:TRINITY_DN4578_c0_g1_i1.p1 TRINITY_DN4578_c0_g1~~TRINITY_DN4578_c0_g1_i1.p1  ORF type:complete len:147 (-),score=18.08 TRINITY_DN4578_c0_g1_i1:346-786(-)